MQVQESPYCVNCKVSVEQQKSYILTYVDDHRIVSLVSNWISPEIITDEDLICGNCYNTAVTTVNKFPVPENPGKKICLLCSRPYDGRRKHLILRENPTELDQVIAQIVESETPQQITSSDHLCNPCFKKIKDKATTTRNRRNITETVDTALEVIVKSEPNESDKDPLQICIVTGVKTEPDDDKLEINDDKVKNNADKRKSISEDHPTASENQTNDEIQPKRRKNLRVEHNNDHNDTEIVEGTNDDHNDGDVEVVEDANDSIEVLEDDEVETVEDPKEPKPKDTIHLPNYKRAANSSGHCFFFGCKSSESRHSFNDEVRAVMLANYKYYIPKNARVCFEHLSGDGWDTLNQTESMNTFNAKQIEHMLSLFE